MCDLQIGLSETSTKAKDPLREFNTRNVPQGSEKGLKKKHNTSTLRGVALTHLRSDARIFQCSCTASTSCVFVRVRALAHRTQLSLRRTATGLTLVLLMDPLLAGSSGAARLWPAAASARSCIKVGNMKQGNNFVN